MKVKDYLQGASPKHFFIFDSHQEAMEECGVKHGDQDYRIYTYNIHKNNKPCVGDIFLYRRPAKSSKDKKFYLYGGGRIRQISQPDEEGNVKAFLDMPFQLTELLKQGEAKLEGFQWTSKKKKADSWENFWNQYGMNTINAQDFWKLAGELECIAPTIYNLEPACQREAMEDLETDVSALKTLNFEVSYIRDGVSAQPFSEVSSYDGEGRHVDHLEIQQDKMKLGLAGEYLVLGILRKKYQGTGAIIEHTSVAKGDGLGYDILVMEEGGTVYRIEVKTTKDPYVDGFYLTPKEKKVSEQCTPTIKYQIYRVYNFDAERESASIKIYNAPLGEEKFQFSPVSWKVYEKRKE